MDVWYLPGNCTRTSIRGSWQSMTIQMRLVVTPQTLQRAYAWGKVDMRRAFIFNKLSMSKKTNAIAESPSTGSTSGTNHMLRIMLDVPLSEPYSQIDMTTSTRRALPISYRISPREHRRKPQRRCSSMHGPRQRGKQNISNFCRPTRHVESKRKTECFFQSGSRSFAFSSSPESPGAFFVNVGLWEDCT